MWLSKDKFQFSQVNHLNLHRLWIILVHVMLDLFLLYLTRAMRTVFRNFTTNEVMILSQLVVAVTLVHVEYSIVVIEIAYIKVKEKS